MSQPAKKLLRGILPRGYSLQYTGGSGAHMRIADPDGNVLRDPITGMPVTISNSPSGKNWEKSIKRDVLKALKNHML